MTPSKVAALMIRLRRVTGPSRASAKGATAGIDRPQPGTGGRAIISARYAEPAPVRSNRAAGSMAVRSAPVDAALPGLSDRAGAAVPARRAWDGPRSVPPPGPHGGDGARVAEALGVDPGSILDLSQNLNPFAPDVAAVARQHLDALRRYPDPSAATRLLADAIGVRPERLVLTNGGAAAVAAVAAEIGGRVRSEPEFGLHPRGAGGPVWRSDPHNPSGVLAAAGETADVWDEAFYPLATGRWSAGRDGVVVGSLTKVFACPGLRLGYVIADDVERFARHVPEWAVGSLGVAVLAELLESADLPRWAREVASARAALADVFARRGWDVVAADAPWVLVRAPGLRERLAPEGIVVRDCAGFGMPGHVRVAVPDSPGLDRLARALDRLSNGDSGS
ncbi:MAG: aminotransferase class I/II-fold pyridoxal phosphate-dependent enzyme [Acidimicrobiaceae bacterium]|nr:aminotransferase class I/II-fold pyridoxal phosphate-dependent enzyme [Acidimicrobiaceae bacterium]